MKILVTGGSGFIGHHVVNKLEARSIPAVVLDNLTDYGIIPPDEHAYLCHERTRKWRSPFVKMCITDLGVEQTLLDHEIDTVIHLASFPRQRIVNQNPHAASAVMIGGLCNLLEASVHAGVKKFVYISSSMIYGDFEHGATEDHVPRPRGQYAIMKLTGEHLVQDYSSRFPDMRHVILRPSAVYGAGDAQDRVISKLMLAAFQNQDLVLYGPDQVLDFTYVNDVACGIIDATVNENSNNKIYNITRGYGWSLSDTAEMIMDICKGGKLRYEAHDPAYPKRNQLSSDRARQDWGYTPRTDLAQGLLKYAEWYRSSSYWSQRIYR